MSHPALRSFWVNFSAWGGTGGVNNLAGSCAFFSVLLLWLSSLSWVRRRFYEVRLPARLWGGEEQGRGCKLGC